MGWASYLPPHQPSYVRRLSTTERLNDQTYIRWNQQWFAQSLVPWQRGEDASFNDLFVMMVSFRSNVPLGLTKRPPDHLHPIFCVDRLSATDGKLMLVDFAWQYTRPEKRGSLDDDVWTCHGLRYKRLPARQVGSVYNGLLRDPNVRFEDGDPSAIIGYFVPPDLIAYPARNNPA